MRDEILTNVDTLIYIIFAKVSSTIYIIATLAARICRIETSSLFLLMMELIGAGNIERK